MTGASVVRCIQCGSASYFANVREGEVLTHGHMFLDGRFVNLGWSVARADTPDPSALTAA